MEIMLKKDALWPTASVIILNYNGMEFVDSCLRSVLKTDYPNFEVIFVDDNSTDGSLEYAEKNFSSPHLRFVANDRHYGFAEGNNIGGRHAKGTYLIFLNVDTEVDPSWLRELVKVMESDQTIGAAQSKLLSARDRKILDCAGGFLDRYGFGYFRGRGREDRGQYGIGAIFFALGAAIAVKQETFNKVESFDPSFYFQCEEVDLCWRIWLSGYKVVYVPTSVVYHVCGGIRRGMEKRVAKYGRLVRFHAEKNDISMLLKNYEASNLVKYLPVTLGIMCCAALFPTLKGNLNETFNRLIAYLEAISWNLFNFKQTWIKRLRIQRIIRQIPDYEITSKLMVKTPVAAFQLG